MNSRQIPLESFVENSHSNFEFHKIIFGDIGSSLLNLNDNSIHTAITSPPYWNQRDYGFDGQIGNEPKIEDYIAKLTNVFALLKNKLVEKGVFYLNIGDKYLAKYGNTPLGMIPYKLAESLIDNGWILQDTIIWHKPNHMPSSVKNRFTNTYEPIFVLVKDENNYYKEYLHSYEYSNFIQVSLQQNAFKHIATYPENLIKSLLAKLNLPKTAIILDPFAGSGTTTFAVKEINKQKKSHYSSIAIEAKKEFVQIIQTRCNISSKNVNKIPFNPKISYPQNKANNNKKILMHEEKFVQDSVEFKSSSLIIKTFTISDHSNIIKFIDDDSFVDLLDDSGLLICIFNFLDPYLMVALTNSTRWIVRNVILRWEEKVAFPMLLLVKDIKTRRYKFNLDAIREDHYNKDKIIWNTVDFRNVKVLKTNSLFKITDEGHVDEILTINDQNFPMLVKILWNSNTETMEETLNFLDTNRFITFSCPACKAVLVNYYQNRTKINCPNCSLELWESYETIPVLSIENELVQSQDISAAKGSKNELSNVTMSNTKKKTEKSYKGKFTIDDKINRGQSPGARLSVTEQYFFVTRYYSIEHGLIAKYLNLLLKYLKVSKQEFVNRFPEGYKHTIGHWFRYDMGGSLPKIEDIELMEEKLDFHLDPNYKKLITRTGIKFQSVLQDKQGKNPGDFLNIPTGDIIDFFKKIVF